MSIRSKLISGSLPSTVNLIELPKAVQEIEYESEEFIDVVHYRLFERLRP
jgi:hypothetical protein